MRTIKLVLDDQNHLCVEGNFEFEIGPLVMYPNRIQEGPLVPTKRITFEFSPECPQGYTKSYKSLEEKIAEQLKQDFLKLLKNDQKD